MELKPDDIASLPPEQQEQILALVCAVKLPRLAFHHH
jgi:hypothetical protein